MGAQKHSSKGGGGGGYVGGFLHLFDWNAKSRKKLFSSKSESPEQPKQTKRTDGNMPITRFNTMDEEEMIGRLSLKESSDYSCATSITDEDGYGTKAPGVVARLMGLDSLPTFNFSDTYSNPSFDSQSLRDLSSKDIRKNPEFESIDCQMEPVSRVTKVKPQKINRAIEKFQTETLPPKSAKSIPITSYKLLSPIKNSGFVSSSNPARIMEAASKIPLIGSSSPSSSVPLRVKVSREKVENSSRKPKIPEASRTPLEPKKSISLALQAKANVQKREGLNHRAQSVKTQTSTERNTHKNPVSSNVLKQNNQKQNSLVDRGKSTPQMKKPVSQKNSSKIVSENLKTSHKKEPCSVPRRKRSMEESEKNAIRERNYQSNKSDVISFTFTAPISRPVNGFLSNDYNASSSSSSLCYNVIGGDALSTLLEQKLRELTGNPASVSRDSLPPNKTDNRDDSSYEFSSYNPRQDQDRVTTDDSSYGFSRNDPLELMKKPHKLDPNRERIIRDESSYAFDRNDPLELMKKQRKLDLGQDRINSDDLSTEFSSYNPQERMSRDYEYRKFLTGQEPSPNSVLEPSFITESCNSSDTATSFKQNSASVQAMELIASRNPSPMDIDIELLDSASSITAVSKFEPDYVKQVLSDIQTMFVDFTIGKTLKIVNPRVFDRLEFGRPDQEAAKLRRELVFNCVSECMESRCRVWAKGLATVRKPDRLAEEVYQEIAGWEEMKDSMVDDLVDKDMSGYSYKKWLDFDVEAVEIGVEIESRLLDSLINEVVDDILVL